LVTLYNNKKANKTHKGTANKPNMQRIRLKNVLYKGKGRERERIATDEKNYKILVYVKKAVFLRQILVANHKNFT
jgi:hypothetical protein